MERHSRHVHGYNLHFAIRLTKKSCDGRATRALGVFGSARAKTTTVLTVNKTCHYQQHDKAQLEGLENILHNSPSIPCVGTQRHSVPQKVKEEIEEHVHVPLKNLVIIGDQFSINCTCVPHDVSNPTTRRYWTCGHTSLDEENLMNRVG